VLVSLIFSACNQGEWVRRTIPLAKESLGAVKHEIVVVDDQSIDGCCHGLPRDVLVVRTEQRVGVSIARRIAVSKARGDVLLFSDPHCEYPGNALARLVQLGRINQAIVQPPTKSRPQSSRVAYGGRLEDSDRGIVVRTSRGQAQAWPALINTIYAVRRDIYESMGGWPELPGCWGYSEQAMTLLAWSCNVPILVADTDICVHFPYQIDRRLPYFTSTTERAINAHYVHATFFPRGYETHWRELLEARFGRAAECQAALRERTFRNLRRQIQRHGKLRSEDLLYAHVDGLPAGLMGGEHVLAAQQRIRALEMGHKGHRPRLAHTLDWFCAVIPGCLTGRTALDVGAHDGLGCDYLRAKGCREVEGVELVPEMVQAATDRGRPVRQGDMRRLPHQDAVWDVVTCVHALEHVPNPAVVVGELLRVLRPGGWLLLVVPREAKPNAENAHNCAFPDSKALRRLVSKNSDLDMATLRIKVTKYSKDELEIRLAVRKKTTGG